MPAPLTVVIPTLNATTTLGSCVASLIEGVSEGLIAELVLSDGGSTDDIAILAEDLGAKVLTGTPGRGCQLARGAEAAKSPWLLFLHSDTVLSDGWVKTVLTHITDHPDRAGYGRLRFAEQGLMARITAGWANLRSGVLGLPYGDQGLLISRQLYNACGGYPDQPLMEDVAIARRLRGRLRPLGFVATTSGERYTRAGWIRQGTRNLVTLGLYFMGRSAEELAERYQSRN